MHAGNLRHACCIFIVPKSIRKSLKTNIKKNKSGNVLWLRLNSVRLQWFMSIVKYKLSFSTALMSTIDKWWWFLRFCTVFANCAALALKLSSRQEPDAAGIPALAYFTGLHWALNNGKLVHDVSSYGVDWFCMRHVKATYRKYWKHRWCDNYLLKDLGNCWEIELFQSYFCVILTAPWRIPQVETVQLPTAYILEDKV